MRKNVFGRKLKRDKNERKALFKSLMSSLVLREKIKTSEAKAKAIKPEIEKLVTKAKKKEKGAMQVLEKSLSKQAFDKIVNEIGPRFEGRHGGYTRIVRLGQRFGDNSPLVQLEWVEIAVSQPVEKEAKKPNKKAEKVENKTKEKAVKKKTPSKSKTKK